MEHLVKITLTSNAYSSVSIYHLYVHLPITITFSPSRVLMELFITLKPEMKLIINLLKKQKFKKLITQSAGAVEYTNCFSAEG